MAALDAVNRRWGRGALTVAGAGINRPWTLKREMISPAYTTRLSDVPSALAR